MSERDLSHRATVERPDNGYTLLYLTPQQAYSYWLFAGSIPNVKVNAIPLRDGRVSLMIEGSADARSKLLTRVADARAAVPNNRKG